MIDLVYPQQINQYFAFAIFHNDLGIIPYFLHKNCSPLVFDKKGKPLSSLATTPEMKQLLAVDLDQIVMSLHSQRFNELNDQKSDFEVLQTSK